MKNRPFQYLKNRLSHEDETWYGCKVHQVYVTFTGFVWLFSIQGEISDALWNLIKTIMQGLLKDYLIEGFNPYVIIICHDHNKCASFWVTFGSRSQD